MDTDTESETNDQAKLSVIAEEGEVSNHAHGPAADPDQALSEEQTYQETMRSIRSFICWLHIPDMDTTASSSYDNPFAGPKLQPARKVLSACQLMTSSVKN